MTSPKLSPELSVVIPCYNEVENVRAICGAVSAQAASCTDSHEIILIDNGSTDGTREIMRQLCAEHLHIRVIFNNRNYGQMRSPTYGIYQAEGAAVIGMCADFQDPPEIIPQLVRQWRAGAQVVLGQRRSEKASLLLGLARRWGYAFMGRFGDYPVVAGATGFGLFDREVVNTLAAWNEPEPFFRGMVVESGFRLALVPFDRPERKAGESKNDAAALASFALSGLAGSAKSLLRLPILFSFYAAVLAAGMLLATLATLIVGGPVWPLVLLTTQVGMFAVLLLFMGLTGDQVRMLAERCRNVPLVIEEERINFPDDRARPSKRTLIQRP